MTLARNLAALLALSVIWSVPGAAQRVRIPSSSDKPEPVYSEVEFKVPVSVENKCDWPQTVEFRVDGPGRDKRVVTVPGKGTATAKVTIVPLTSAMNPGASFIAEITATHPETTQGAKKCLALDKMHLIESDFILPKPKAAYWDLSPDVKTFKVTLTQTGGEEAKKKVVTDTRTTPPAAQMPGDPPAPGNKPTDKPADKPTDKPADKPGDKPAEKPPETTGGRPGAAPPQPKSDPGRFLPPPPVNKPPLRASPLETPATPAAPTPATGPIPVSSPVPTTPVTPAPAAPGKPATPDGPKPPGKTPPATTTSAPVEGIGDLWDVLFGLPAEGLPPLPTMEDLRREILGKEDPWTYEQLDRDREEQEQREMLKRFEFEAEPTDVMEPDPIALVARAGRALLSWLRRPADGTAALAAAARPLDSRIARVRGSGGEQVRPQDVSVAFIATGEASGQAFTVKVLNRTGKRVNISLPDGVVLAPAAGSVPARAVNARGTSSHPIVGYCVEHAKQTPSAGALFAVAPASVQQRYKGVTNVLRSGRLLDRFKRLTPQGDAESYGHSVQQWALWTKLEGWSHDRFTSQFVERTKKNISEMKGKWNKDVEKAVRDSAVGRWADIGKILRVGQWIDAHETELRRK